MNESQLTVGQLLAVLTRNKKKCILVFMLTMAGVVAFWMLAPRKYGSEGRLFVQLGRANTGIEYTKGSLPIAIQDARETEVRSVIELIKSYDVLSKVVQDPEVTIDAVLESPFDFITDAIKIPSFGGGTQKEGELSSEEREHYLSLQKAVKTVGENLSVEMEKKTSVISVYVKAQSPMLAKRIIDRLLHYTLEAHVNVHRRNSTVSFFETELALQKEKVVNASQALEDYRNQVQDSRGTDKPFLTVEGARNTLQSIIDKLEHEKLDAELNRTQAVREVEKLSEEMVAMGKFIEVPTKGVERLSTESAKEEIIRLKSEQAQLKSTYNDHPRLEIIQSRLKQLESDFKTFADDRTEMASVSNPAYEDISVERARAVTKANSLESRLEEIDKKYQFAMAELKKLNRIEVEVGVLKQNLNIEQQYLAEFVNKQGDVSVISKLDKQNVSDIVIQQAGTLGLKHVSPKGSILLPLGLVMAVALSVLTALGFEGRSQLLLQNEEEVEEVLDLPVLITLPRVANRRAMVR